MNNWMSTTILMLAFIRQRITQHIRYGLSPLPFRTLLPTVATSYTLGTLSTTKRKEEMSCQNCLIGKKH
ncbi:MAG: hypothetical protein WBD09_08980 [Halobacteriota archaeon]